MTEITLKISHKVLCFGYLNEILVCLGIEGQLSNVAELGKDRFTESLWIVEELDVLGIDYKTLKLLSEILKKHEIPKL